MDHIRLTWTNQIQRGNWRSLFQHSNKYQSIARHPSLFTDWQGASVSGETMQKHCISCKIGGAREVRPDQREGYAGPNEVGFLVWSLSRNFLKI